MSQVEKKTRDELMSADLGLYAVDERKDMNVADISHGEMFNGTFELLARVRESGPIPNGVEDVIVRPDGRQIIFQWVMTAC